MPHYMPSSVYTMNYIWMIDLALNTIWCLFPPSGSPGLREEDNQSSMKRDHKIELITNNPDTEAPEVDLNAIEISSEPTNPDAPNGETASKL